MFVENFIENFEIRSEDIQEILGRPPKWIVRWGVSIMFLVVLMLIVGSCFYKYPEKISSQIIIHTENMPAIIVSKTSGKIEEIFISDKQFVEANTSLAVIENGANYHDVLLLKQHVDSFRLNLFQESLFEFQVFENLRLGDIQPAYTNFVKALNDFSSFQTASFLEKKIINTNYQLSHHQDIYLKYKSLVSIQKEQFDIAGMIFQRDSVLYRSSIISKSEFEKSQSALLQTKMSYENSRIAVDNIKISITQLEQTVLELEQQNDEQKKQLQISLQTAIENLQNSINSWFLNYVYIAPISGDVAFVSIWQKNQNVTIGEKVFFILPKNETKVVGKIKLPIQGAGKVNVGQKVIVKIDNYPYMEYGVLSGIVTSISLLPSENFYFVEIEFPEGLVTSYKKEIEFSQNMIGSAEILTDDIRLIQRFVQPIKHILYN